MDATILLDERFADDCIAGLAEYSHVDIVYLFDRVDPNNVHSGRATRAIVRTGRSSASSLYAPRPDPTDSA